MSKFSKKNKSGSPAISTASLPDIVFMLLFFFMVATTMKEVEYKVQIKLPEATQVKKIEDKSLVTYIYIGSPTDKLQDQFGAKPVIQLNDKIQNIGDIQTYVEQVRGEKSEADAKNLTYSLKVDADTEMGIVVDVKEEMRIVQALKINYSAKRPQEK